MIKRVWLVFGLFGSLLACSWGQTGSNLLLNSAFEFHAFAPHRDGKAGSYRAHSVAFWRHDAYGDVTVMRESHVPAGQRPVYSAANLVSIAPGKRFFQFIPLPEAGLAHGDIVSFSAGGWQSAPGALQASLVLLKLDSADGTWKPADFGASDQREFPRHARGELVVAGRHDVVPEAAGPFELAVENFPVTGHFTSGAESRSADSNTIALQVEFRNLSAAETVWVWSPCLALGSGVARRGLPVYRVMEPSARHIPRTMQKLWKGEALHILLMGSSIDRGSANPPLYCYDEDPQSPTFKQPHMPDRQFDPERVQRPDLDGYVGWWQHYYSYAGRLRLELMRRFDLPVAKICLNFMACDGSCVGEAHSGLAEYCGLQLPPEPGTNGYKAGGEWKTLHPELFSRPEGPGPDLVIFGSGANEKTDTPDEVAVFEGTIRWIQRHYPHTEFLFCMFQNQGGYTPNSADLQALALRYQIPLMDYGKLGDMVTRWCNSRTLVPSDGHPQAASHDLWFHVLSRAFEAWAPTPAGQAQLHLPERVHGNTVNWEGEMVTYSVPSPRLRENMFILDDGAFNVWLAANPGSLPEAYVNGVKYGGMRKSSGSGQRDLRNSSYRWGRGELGERQVVEIVADELRIQAVDMKQIPGRRYFGMDHPLWRCPSAAVPYESGWGAPFGSRQVVLEPGQTVSLLAAGTDFALAYVDREDGGTLEFTVDDGSPLLIPARVPYVSPSGQSFYMENRRAWRGLPFGLHRLQVRALEGPVALLGAYAYDLRPNRRRERLVSGLAAAGETVVFSPSFKAVPLIVCTDGLRVDPSAVQAGQVTFSGSGTGSFQAWGE